MLYKKKRQSLLKLAYIAQVAQPGDGFKQFGEVPSGSVLAHGVTCSVKVLGCPLSNVQTPAWRVIPIQYDFPGKFLLLKRKFVIKFLVMGQLTDPIPGTFNGQCK